MPTSTAYRQELDRQIDRAIDRDQMTGDVARLVRAIAHVRPGTPFAIMVAAAKSLDDQRIRPHQIRTNYRACGITYDLVHEAIRKAAATASTADQIRNAFSIRQSAAESLAYHGAKVVDGVLTAPCGCQMSTTGATKCNH